MNLQTIFGILFILTIIALSIIAVLLSNASKARYIEKIIYLESLINHTYPCKENFLSIMDRFDEIRFFDADPERTEKLFRKFTGKFINEWLDFTFHEKDQGRRERYMNIHNQMMPA